MQTRGTSTSSVRSGRHSALMVGYFGSKGDRLRISRNINQFINGVRPFPTLSASSPILPGAPLGNITEIDSLGLSHYKGLWLSANQRHVERAAVQRVVHVVEVDRLQLPELAGGRRAEQLQHRRQRRAVRLRRAPPLRGQRHLRAAVQAATRSSTAGSSASIFQAQSGNPVNIVTNVGTFNGVANTLRPDLIGTPVITGTPNQWFSNAVCDPRIAGSCTSSSVFALPVSADGAFHFGNLGATRWSGRASPTPICRS